MAVEAGGDEDHVWLEGVEPRYPVGLDQLADLAAAGVGGHRQVDHVVAHRHAAAEGVELVLEDADHQDALVAGHDVLGAVAMVHVEIDDGHALEPAHLQRMPRGNRHVVVEAEAHGRVAGGVVAGRADGAEGVLDAAVDHRIGGRHRRTGGTQHGLARGGVDAGVGVDGLRQAAVGGAVEHLVQFTQIALAVGSLQVAARSQRRVHAGQRDVQAGGQQVILDRIEALRAFGVAGAHVVATAIGVGKVGSAHRRSPAGWRLRATRAACLHRDWGMFNSLCST